MQKHPQPINFGKFNPQHSLSALLASSEKSGAATRHVVCTFSFNFNNNTKLCFIEQTDTAYLIGTMWTDLDRTMWRVLRYETNIRWWLPLSVLIYLLLNSCFYLANVICWLRSVPYVTLVIRAIFLSTPN